MHTITAGRLQAAQCAISAMCSRVWEFTHETGCTCRATFDGTLLETEVVAGPDSIDVNDSPHGWCAYERAVWAALEDLDRAGISRTAVASAAAAERELRLVAVSLREIAP